MIQRIEGQDRKEICTSMWQQVHGGWEVGSHMSLGRCEMHTMEHYSAFREDIWTILCCGWPEDIG